MGNIKMRNSVLTRTAPFLRGRAFSTRLTTPPPPRLQTRTAKSSQKQRPKTRGAAARQSQSPPSQNRRRLDDERALPARQSISSRGELRHHEEKSGPVGNEPM